MAKKETKNNGKLAAILDEGKKIHWVSLPELGSGFVQSIVFLGIFAGFFAVCDLVSALILRGIG